MEKFNYYYVNLMIELQQVPLQYHKLLFHKWISNHTTIHVLKTQAHEMLWH